MTDCKHTDRCHTCDLPRPTIIETDAAIAREETGQPPDEAETRLCWAMPGQCRRTPVDWRARCLAMETVVEAAEAYVDDLFAGDKPLVDAVDAYRKAKS